MVSDPKEDIGVLVDHFDPDEHDVKYYLAHPETVDEHRDMLCDVVPKIRETEHMPKGNVLPVPRMDINTTSPLVLGSTPDKEEAFDLLLRLVHR